MTGILVLCAGITIYAIVYLLLEPKGKEEDLMQHRIKSIGESNSAKSAVVLRDEELGKPLSERFLKPILDAVAKNAKRMGKNGQQEPRAKSKKTLEQEAKLRTQLRQAGIKLEPQEYNTLKVFSMLGITILGAIVGAVANFSVPFCALIGLYGSFAFMRFNLTTKISKRRELMERQLPDVLDLLSVSVEAGLGFEQSLKHIIDNMQGPLVDELNVCYREMSMGRSRRDSLQGLAERCGFEEIINFTSAVIQAGQLGISLKNVLKSQSAAMRVSRRNKVQEKAYKMSTKILLPLVFFIFPVIFIVLLGPAVINIMSIL